MAKRIWHALRKWWAATASALQVISQDQFNRLALRASRGQDDRPCRRVLGEDIVMHEGESSRPWGGRGGQRYTTRLSFYSFRVQVCFGEVEVWNKVAH